MEVLLPVLHSVKTLSGEFSKDKEIVMHKVLNRLFTMDHYLKNYHKSTRMQAAKNNQQIKLFCTSLAEHLNKEFRFNEMGKFNSFYTLGNLLHPHSRGSVLKQHGVYDQVVQKLIEEHPSTEAFVASQAGQGGQETEMDVNQDFNFDSIDPDDILTVSIIFFK